MTKLEIKTDYNKAVEVSKHVITILEEKLYPFDNPIIDFAHLHIRQETTLFLSNFT